MKGNIILTMSLLWASLAGCAGEGPLEEVDPAAAPATPTWGEHVEEIVAFRCGACHSEAGQAMTEGISYDTCEDVRRSWRDFEETVFDNDSMPPAGAPRVTSAERLTLQRWHDQGAACP